MIIKTLVRRKIRTLLTTLGIAIGVAAVVALGSFADSFVNGYKAMTSGSGADLLVMQDEALDIMFSAIDKEMGTVIGGLSDVEQVSNMIYTFAATDGIPYFIVYGYDPDSFAIEHFKIVEGESLSKKKSGRGGKPLLLGKAAADDLEKKVGDTFSLYESSFRIVGIFETGQPFEDGSAVVLLEDAEVISGKPRQVSAFLLKVEQGTDLDNLRARIERRFSGVTVTLSANYASDQDFFQYIQAFTWVVSMVAVLIGGVGIMNTMLMSVFERTREFGVLRAVGWRPRRVLMTVLGESLVLSVLGGIVGTLIGMGAVRLLTSMPAAGMLRPESFSPTLLMQGMGIALGLGLFGGGLPAWRASKLLPAEAMRSESGSVHVPRHVRWAVLRNILRQPTRTLLTVIGIAIAMMAILLLGAMGEGIMNAMSGMAGGAGADLVGIETDASVDLSKIDQGIVRRIATLAHVESAEGFLTGYTQLGDLPFFIVFGYQPRGRSITGFPVVEGEQLTTNRQILLGRAAAENLKKEVGQTLRIFDSTFKIVGIFETGVPFQDGGGILTLRDAQRLFGQARKVSFMGIWLDDPSKTKQVITEAQSRFPEITLSKSSDFAEDLNDMQMMRASTWAISAMALIVGGLGMTNTMAMSVFERTREIGVLRALGWRKRRILRMIVRESVMLSLLGAVVGIVAGVGLGLILNLLPFLQGFVELEFKFGLFVQAIGTALILGVVGGAYPAWRATQLLPVEALRYE